MTYDHYDYTPREPLEHQYDWPARWERAWDDGRDVTLEHPSTWPDGARAQYLAGWRPWLRSTERPHEWPDESEVPPPVERWAVNALSRMLEQGVFRGRQ
jgi:hypothetical protein